MSPSKSVFLLFMQHEITSSQRQALRPTRKKRNIFFALSAKSTFRWRSSFACLLGVGDWVGHNMNYAWDGLGGENGSLSLMADVFAHFVYYLWQYLTHLSRKWGLRWFDKRRKSSSWHRTAWKKSIMEISEVVICKNLFSLSFIAFGKWKWRRKKNPFFFEAC